MYSHQSNPVKIGKQALCELIPHSGSMCLLNSVEYWDKESIVCVADDINTDSHPLQHQGKFSALAMLELGAQAMAVHGGLLASVHHEPVTPGYLAAIRNSSFFITYADDRLTGPLKAEARRVYGDSRSQLYEFSILHQDRCLVSARATVMSQTVT